MKQSDSLTNHFQPSSYKLRWLVSNDDRDAEALITVSGHKIGPPSRRLIFHQSGLKVTRAEITAHTKKGDQKVNIERINHHGSFEQVRLHSKETLYPGRYTVIMAFTAKPAASREKPSQIEATYQAGQSVRKYFPLIDESQAIANASLEIKTSDF